MESSPTVEAKTRPVAPVNDGAETTIATAAPPAPIRAGRSRRRILWIVGVVVALGLAAYFVVPAIRTAMTTVSTDDAYVNSHVTYAAPRISETVVEVFVDDNYHVKKGDLLVRLDPSTWRINVGQAEATLGIARRNAALALAQSRALIALAKANHFRLTAAITNIRDQIANLRVAVARLDEARATERLTQIEAERFQRLFERNAENRETVDVRLTDYAQARARSRQSLEAIHQIRAALEIPEEPEKGKPLDDVPPGLDQRHSTVISALSAFAQNLADLGVELPHYHETPDDYIKRIHSLAPDGDLDRLLDQTASNAPAVEAARAQVTKAEEDLRLARLNLSYCEIRSDIDGYVSNRAVNPGNRLVQGQRLMAIRSESEIWIDCNFKETQLDPVRIGHPVDFYVDAYPGKVFKGHVTGFSPGTGQSLALLPAQNATGNFVKIVQRLPVRVELDGPNPADTPLFVGLSVVPYVRIKERPEGPNAGARLQAHFPAMTAGSPTLPGPATESRPTYPPGEMRVNPARTVPGSPR